LNLSVWRVLLSLNKLLIGEVKSTNLSRVRLHRCARWAGYISIATAPQIKLELLSTKIAKNSLAFSKESSKTNLSTRSVEFYVQGYVECVRCLAVTSFFKKFIVFYIILYLEMISFLL
jgi:hypothetical protein